MINLSSNLVNNSNERIYGLRVHEINKNAT